MSEIFTRYRDAVQLVTDNGAENVHRIMAEALANLNTTMFE